MIKRKIFADLRNHLNKPEISLIIGPRQAGKTTIMFFLQEELEKQRNKTVFFNLDIEAHKRFFSSQESLLRKIKLEIGDSQGFIFIDEIERKDNAGLFLKGLYDMNLPYKFIVSGSGSIELKEKIHESLAGRKRVFELSTVSFEEFVDFKTNSSYSEKMKDFFKIEHNKIQELLNEYLNFGGYPRVILEQTIKGKQAILDEIYQSYLEKDISYLLHLENTEKFTNLVKVMADQTGKIVNISEISRTLSLAQPTVKDYLWYFQKTFILYKVTPFFKNVRKELTKSPIFYWYDVGLRNYALGLLGNIDYSQSAGFLFQNLVYQLLRERLKETSATIHFWRTTDGAEVDFVIFTGQEQIPIEVKYISLKKPLIPRSLQSFINKYHPNRAYIVNLNFEANLIVDKTTISFLPFYNFLDVDSYNGAPGAI